MDIRPKSVVHAMGSKLKSIFYTGLLLFIPFYLTIRLLIWVFQNIDDVVQPVVKAIVGYKIPGVGFLATVLAVFIFGTLWTKFVGRQIIAFWESIFHRLPLIRHIFSSIKQVVESFSTKGKGGFRQVVLVEFPRREMWTLGLVTNESVDPAGKKWFNLYIPTPPNPTSGFFAILPEQDVILTSIPVNDGLTMIISSGNIADEIIFKMLAERQAKQAVKEDTAGSTVRQDAFVPAQMDKGGNISAGVVR